MQIIEIASLENGAHRNQDGFIGDIPDGWAVIPDSMEVPETFPFVDIAAEDGVVTEMKAGIVPDVPDSGGQKPSKTVEDRLTALEADAAQAALDRAALTLLLTGEETV